MSPRLTGRVSLIRFADDAALILRNPQDASKVMDVLPKRLGRYGLTLHPEKTRVVAFKPKEKCSIDFLGFTHYWSKTRQGQWCVQRKTMKSRFARAVKAIGTWCRHNRHRPLAEQYWGIAGGNIHIFLLCAVK